MIGFDAAGLFVGKERDANLQHAKSLRATVICCYIVGTPGGFPCSTPADVAAIRALGLLPYANWERAADFFATASQQDCVNAGGEARAAMTAAHWPVGSACAFSFDFDPSSASYPAMLQKLAWVQQGLGMDYAGVPYGSAGLLTYFATNRASYVSAGYKAWLTESTFGQANYLQAFQYAAQVQNHDAAGNWLNSPFPGADVNTILDPAALGAWGPPTDGDIMTEADWARLQGMFARLSEAIITGVGNAVVNVTNAPHTIDGVGVNGHIANAQAAITAALEATPPGSGTDPNVVAADVVALVAKKLSAP